MSLIRCKNFHDDGSVNEICLEGSSCSYIHPSHPEWEQSAPYRSDDNKGIDKSTFRKAYWKMIRYTEHAVRIQIELDTAKEDLSRWKRTQSSKIYAHPGPSTRQFLDTQRRDYTLNVSTLEKQRSRTLNVLSELSCGDKFNALVSGKPGISDEFEPYINELNGWIESLRHLISIPAPPSAAEDPSKWTWDRIEASVVVLNDLCEKFMGLSLMERYTNIDNDAINKSAGANMRVEEAADHSNDVKTRTQVLMLQRQIAKDGEELVQLQDKLRDLEDLHCQMQKRLEGYIRCAEEDTAKIQALSNHVKLLHILPNPAVQPPDDILGVTSKFVAEESKRIVIGYFTTLVGLCLQNNKELLEELDVRLLRSMKQLTKVIYEHASGAQASDSGVK